MTKYMINKIVNHIENQIILPAVKTVKMEKRKEWIKHKMDTNEYKFIKYAMPKSYYVKMEDEDE